MFTPEGVGMHNKKHFFLDGSVVVHYCPTVQSTKETGTNTRLKKNLNKLHMEVKQLQKI